MEGVVVVVDVVELVTGQITAASAQFSSGLPPNPAGEELLSLPARYGTGRQLGSKGYEHSATVGSLRRLISGFQ